MRIGGWMTVGAALLVLAGCTSGGEAPKADGTAPAGDQSKPFKVALLTPGPVSDAGWDAMAYKGLQAIEKELGATVNNQEATGSQKLDAMRSYAQDGYSLVFGHGFEYNDPAAELGPAFPDTFFVTSSGGKTGPNLYGVVGRPAGSQEDYKYSDALLKLKETGEVWTVEDLAAYITDPNKFVQEKTGDSSARTKMTFKLNKNQADIAAYLASVAPAAQ